MIARMNNNRNYGINESTLSLGSDYGPVFETSYEMEEYLEENGIIFEAFDGIKDRVAKIIQWIKEKFEKVRKIVVGYFQKAQNFINKKIESVKKWRQNQKNWKEQLKNLDLDEKMEIAPRANAKKIVSLYKNIEKSVNLSINAFDTTIEKMLDNAEKADKGKDYSYQAFSKAFEKFEDASEYAVADNGRTVTVTIKEFFSKYLSINVNSANIMGAIEKFNNQMTTIIDGSIKLSAKLYEFPKHANSKLSMLMKIDRSYTKSQERKDTKGFTTINEVFSNLTKEINDWSKGYIDICADLVTSVTTLVRTANKVVSGNHFKGNASNNI